MYCQGCGSTNPENAYYCLKCGRNLNQGTEDCGGEVDIALASRVSHMDSVAAGRFASRVLIITGIICLLILLPIAIMTFQLKLSFPVLTRAAGVPAGFIDANPAAPNSSDRGTVLAPKTDPTVLARDTARKANAMNARASLEQYFAEYGRYPRSLDDLEPGMLGFVPDKSVYRYTTLSDGYDFELVVMLESKEVSGADVVKDNETTKLVIRAAN